MEYDKIDKETVENSYVRYEKDSNGPQLQCGIWDHLGFLFVCLIFERSLNYFGKILIERIKCQIEKIGEN